MCASCDISTTNRRSRVQSNSMYFYHSERVPCYSHKVLNGNPYNRKCDVYSYRICVWEINCCDMPYPDLNFSEVTSAVVRQNLRPEIPRCYPSSLANELVGLAILSTFKYRSIGMGLAKSRNQSSLHPWL